MALGTKLMTAFLACGLIPLGVIAYVSYSTAHDSMNTIKQQASADLEQKAYDQLVASRDGKRSEIERFISGRMNDVRFLADNPAVLDGMMSSCVECHEVGDDDAIREVSDEEAKKHQAWLNSYAQDCGYTDLYLITHTGQVVYTTGKRSDLGGNVVDGDLAGSPLAACFERAMSEVAFEDFAPYAPNGGLPFAFIGVPVEEGNTTIGVLAMQLSNDGINEITLERAGLGDSGETYLVGPDGLMRSDSYLDPEHRTLTASFQNPETGKVETQAAKAL